MPSLLERLGVELPAGLGDRGRWRSTCCCRSRGGTGVEAAAGADVVVTFWGKPRRRTAGVWLHQCGSAGEAREAQAAGADGVIVQGVEAGGHVRGTVPALQLLEQARAALPPD